MAGRRVYRKNTGVRKQRKKTALYVAAAVLILAVLGFLGYVVAEPINRYISQRREGLETNPWTPPSLPGELAAENPPADGNNNGSDTDEDTGEARLDFSAIRIPVSAMSDSESLKEALVQARNNGYTAAVVTLKDKGGAIYYNTASEMARTASNAVQGEMSAEHICTLITAAGLRPIASVNLLEDHNMYGAYKTGSYKFEGTTSTWYDNAVDRGGKPWLSPFSEDTQNFSAFLAEEASKAGFEALIFDGLVFPPFRSSDLNHVGQIVKNENRYLSLINLADIVADAALAHGVTPLFAVPAEDIISGASEFFKPEIIAGKTVLMRYSPESFPVVIIIDNEEIVLSDMTVYDSASAVFGEAARRAQNKTGLIPCVNSGGISHDEFGEILSALIALGHNAYVIG